MNTCQDKVIGVVSSLQNAESLCLDSLSLVVINFIICSLAELETYPSPICCHTMEEQISGIRDHLWGRQSVSSVSGSGSFKLTYSPSSLGDFYSTWGSVGTGGMDLDLDQGLTIIISHFTCSSMNLD